MQHVTIDESAAAPLAIECVAKARASDKRRLALDIYRYACAVPGSYDWRAVADMLASVMPKARAAVESPDMENGPAWASYPVANHARKILPTSPVLLVTFSDGRTIRVKACTLPRKPVNWGAAVEMAVSWYRVKIRNFCRYHSMQEESLAFIDVPAIESVTDEATGAAYPATVANAETESLRAGPFKLPEVQQEAADLELPDASEVPMLDDSVQTWILLRFREARETFRRDVLGEATPAMIAAARKSETDAFWDALSAAHPLPGEEPPAAVESEPASGESTTTFILAPSEKDFGYMQNVWRFREPTDTMDHYVNTMRREDAEEYVRLWHGGPVAFIDGPAVEPLPVAA